ncbi:MAG TPA: LCP family protein, partial [Clostridiaceae bacterium]|nr:LCP family protein [Clostridiaceae bacterium]
DDEVWAVNDVVYEMNSLLGHEPEANLLSGGGRQTLNGTQAIAFARVRAVGSDHERTGRQRIVISAMLNKFSTLNPLDQLETATEVLEQMGTNMRPNNLMSLGINSVLGTNESMDYKVPADETMYTTDSSNWNIMLNWEAQVPALHDFIYNATP